MKTPSNRRRPTKGFTLVEILVSLAVLAMLLLVTANVINQVQRTWSNAAARVSQFREARIAFEILTRNLRQATLNPYIDYDFNFLQTGSGGIGTAPSNYLRKSDLHFVVGDASSLVTGGSEETNPGHAVFFQAPLGVVHDPAYSGLDNLLCARGYFVQFSDDDAFRPPFVQRQRERFRLMEFSPPAESNTIYDVVPPGTPTDARKDLLQAWYRGAGDEMDSSETDQARSETRPVADNILSLLISPRLDPANRAGREPTEIAEGYAYDSADPANDVTATRPQGTLHLLPPQLKVAMIAIDEKTAERLDVDGRLSDLAGVVSKGFTDADKMEDDLESVAEALTEEKVSFRIFTATIGLPSSKWSQ